MKITVAESEVHPHAIINHSALQHNLAQVRQTAPKSKVWAVIKAEAYGHGALEAAKTLTAEGLAVARLSEAKKLRSAGEHRPILIMGGVYAKTALIEAASLDCELAVHNPDQAQTLVQTQLTQPIKIWLKVNTGMNRLGLTPNEAIYWLPVLANCPWIQGRPGLMTHLANADIPTDLLTPSQCQTLKSIPGTETCTLNIGNSAGILGWDSARSDWIRPGIMLYGISPFAGETGLQRGLRPVMTLCAPIIAIHRCQRGDPIGYGGSYVCTENMSVGVIGIGYGDGYPRHAKTGTPVLLEGKRVPIIGRISMDMITVDLRAAPEARLGSKAVLWGEGLPAEEIATAANTIAYQLVTGITTRVSRIHVHG